MHYLGGKTKLAGKIVKAIRERYPSRSVWEPFCGGLSVSVALAKAAPLEASDAHPALIALYSAMQAGWDPPDTLSEEDYARARSLPDSDPLKAFAGFGCSFSGKWFGGFARDKVRAGDHTNEAARGLRKKLPNPAITFRCLSFFDIAPRPWEGIIYCDPPYAGTQGYGMAWDPAAFWARAREWSRFCPVFVSEFTAPAGVLCVLEMPRIKSMGFTRKAAIDRLYLLEEVSPSSGHLR
jgi:DNA adenine methylase